MCITKEQCNAKGNYVNGGDCLTVKECAEKSANVFSVIGECITGLNIVADDFDVKDNVYVCKDSKYIFVDETDAKCVTSDKCVEDGNALYEANKRCVSED